MASFVDQPYQFAPFVETVPVQSMVKVGMIKQQQYDAGVEKVRAYAESLAGLPISDPRTIEYLGKVMENVKTQLRGIAGADFSDNQLVESVGALARRVYKDPVIQNGVRSTARIKQEYEFLEESRKKGTSSPDNEVDFANTVQSWYNRENITDPFSGKYSPYTDYNKIWLETLSKIHPDKRIQQIPFTTFVDPTTGQMMTSDKIAKVMTEYGIEGLTAEKIENALRATLSPNVINQLRIESRVRFRDVPVEKLEELATKKYESLRTAAEKQKEIIEKKLKSSTGDPSKYEILKGNLKDIEKLLGDSSEPVSIQSRLQEELTSIRENPEQAKYEIYKNGAISGFAQGFQYQEESTKYMENPYVKYDQWVAQFELAKSKEQFDRMIALENLSIAKQKLYLQQIKTTGKKGAGGMPGVDGDDDTVGGVIPEPEDWTNDPEKFLTDKAKEHNTIANNVVGELSRALNKTPGEVIKMLQNYNSGGPNGSMNESVFDVQYRKKADAYWSNKSIADGVETNLKNLRAEADKTYVFNENFSIKNPKTGQTLTYSPEEVKEVNRYNALYKRALGGVKTGGITGAAAAQELQKMTEKQRLLLTSINSQESVRASYEEYNEGLVSTSINKEKYVRDRLKDVGSIFEIRPRVITPTTAAQRAEMASTVKALIASAQTDQTGMTKIVKKSGYSGADFDKFLNRNGISYMVADKPDGTKTLYVNGDSGVDMSIDVGPIESNTLSALRGGLTPNDYSMQLNIALNGGASKNLFPRSSFKNVRRIPVRAEIVQELGGVAKYLQIFVQTPQGERPYTFGQTNTGAYGNNSVIEQYVRTVNDSQLISDLETQTNIDDQTLNYLKSLIKR